MTFKYKKQFLVGIFIIILCVASVGLMYMVFGKQSLADKQLNVDVVEENVEPTTRHYDPVSVPIYDGEPVMESFSSGSREEADYFEPAVIGNIPYAVPPKIIDDGSIIYTDVDGKTYTITELTNQLNKSLKSYVKNTGYIFAKYTKTYGLDPFLAVAILNLETGCASTKGCSKLAANCNNFGGIAGGKQRCKAGGRWAKYDSLDEGLESYLNILYKGYILQGLDTPEKMVDKYAEGSPTWAGQVRGFYNSAKNK